jgi:PIN domain nuclease of toxin-antitoxin system
MDPVVHLDTHVVAWLYQGDLERLRPVLHHMEGRRLVVAPMVVLELQYLYEINRLQIPAAEVVEFLANRHGLRTSVHPFADVVRVATGLTWTRDPFDRLIAAQALVEGAPLLTADRTLLANCAVARWT